MKTLGKDQRGFSPMVVVSLIVVLAVAGFAAWAVMNKNKTTTSTPAATVQTSAVQTACNKVYHDATLCKFAAANANFGKLAYTAVDTAVDAQGQTSKFTIEADGKGNTSVTSSGGSTSFASIQIGNTSYIKSPGSTSWTKYTSNAPATTNPASNIKASFSDSSTPAAQQIHYKKLGTQACGKLTCLKYQIIDPASAGTTQYAWFDTKDYRLQQWYSKAADGSTNTFAITYAAVKISVPSPVVDASAAATPSTSTPSAAQIQAEEQAAQAAANSYNTH
jgi:hypothetical protein